MVVRWLVVATTLFLSGCAAPEPATSEAEPDGTAQTVAATQPITHTVDIVGFRFNQTMMTVTVGDTIIWTNQDTAVHTVDSTDGGGLDSGHLGQGDRYGHLFDVPGSFAYQCDIHPSMTATVQVAGQ